MFMQICCLRRIYVYGETSIAQLVRFFVVKTAHLDLSPRLGTSAHIFLNLFQNLSDAIVLVEGDMLVNSEASMVTFSIFIRHYYFSGRRHTFVGLRLCIYSDVHACVRERLHLYSVL